MDDLVERLQFTQVLKGLGHTAGDGWKDTTKVGEVVFVWNQPKPPPYAPGQYPRVGNEVWAASTEQYDFTSATAEEVRQLFADALAALTVERDALREWLVMAVAEMSRARGRLETIASCNEDRRIAAALGRTCDCARAALESKHVG